MTDIALAALAAYTAYTGWRRGLLAELLATLGLLAAIVAGFMFYDVAAGVLGLANTWPIKIAAFLLVAFIVFRLWLWLAQAAGKALRLTALGWADGTLGAAFGLVKFVLAICALLHGLVYVTHTPASRVLGTSEGIPILLRTGDAIYGTIAKMAPILWQWYQAGRKG